MSAFETEFAKLNPAQRQAVETIEGPLLIVAGPGTGKTQTVALRLANILRQTQARPQNLLALTFTEAGAVALKNRLARVIGTSAYGIAASTFHSFAAGLAATFPNEFAQTRERQNLDQLGQYKLLTELLQTGRYEKIAPLRDTDFYTRDLAGRISTLKREGITPAKFAAIVAREEAGLPTGDARLNKKTGAVLGRVETAERRVAKQAELAQLFAAYQKMLTERELADFDDLILSVVEKLTAGDEFLLGYLQEQFLYVTVDEFQDTNGVQSALLAAWASYDNSPNLCAVGDDDQSIYRFQGASLANILEFRERYAGGKIVVLTTNYRSTQPILDAAGAVIANNHERLVGKITGLSKDLVAYCPDPEGCGNPQGRSPPTILECPDETAEAVAVADGVQRLLAAGTPPTEIAVLYRTRQQGDLVAAALARAGVPVTRTDGSDALAEPRVRQLVQLLRALAAPTDATAMLAALLADTSGVATADAYRLARLAERDAGILDFLTDPEILTKFAAGNEDARLPPIVFHDGAAVAAFGQKLLQLLAIAATGTLLELAEAAVATSGLAKIIAEKKEFLAAAALATFLDFVRRYVVAHPDARLAELLADLKIMQNQNLPLPLAAGSVAAVTLATAHGSKGLEWEQVFLLGCHDNPWGGRKKPDLLPLPDLIPRAAAHELTEDERRLFFVALTRAKRGLTVSYPQTVAGKAVAPARFLAELPPSVTRAQPTVPPERVAQLSLPSADTPPLDPESRLFLASLVERLRLSATALNNYLACPRRFLLQSLLRLPGSPDPSERAGAIFGSAAHRGLEEFFREFQKRGTPPPLDTAESGIAAELTREPLTRAERTRFAREVGAAVAAYLAARLPETPPLFVEQNFGRHDLRLGEIPLTGKVDRIDPADDARGCIFIDYKTQQPISREAILGQTANSTGDLHRQLLFYALLARLDPRFVYEVRTVRLDFLRPGSGGTFRSESFTPTAAELTELEKLIQTVWAKISQLEFDCTADREACKRCHLRALCGR